jgi:hypothetical protein
VKSSRATGQGEIHHPTFHNCLCRHHRYNPTFARANRPKRLHCIWSRWSFKCYTQVPLFSIPVLLLKLKRTLHYNWHVQHCETFGIRQKQTRNGSRRKLVRLCLITSINSRIQTCTFSMPIKNNAIFWEIKAINGDSDKRNNVKRKIVMKVPQQTHALP